MGKKTSTISLWQIFRLIFVLFFLYLLGDIFYRWDGFRMHSSFFDFLPSVALIIILWTMLAAGLSICVWCLLVALNLFFQLEKRRVKTEHLYLFMIITGISSISLWAIKRFILVQHGSSFTYKIGAILLMVLIAMLLTWLLRNALQTIQQRIKPLVWIFGFFVFLSVPVISFKLWWGISLTGVTENPDVNYVSNQIRPDIILITFDSLTVENMSLYGYKRLTTPFITEWASEAAVFTRVEAASTWTPPTVASLMSGKRVWTHQLYHSDGAKPVNSDIDNLPRLLQENGYTTLAFTHNQMHASPEIMGISKYFDISPLETELKITSGVVDRIDGILYDLFFKKIQIYNWIFKGDFILSTLLNLIISSEFEKTVTSFSPEKAFSRFLEFLDKQPKKPYFAWIHLYAPHFPYLPPEPYIGMFDSSSKLRTAESQSDLVMKSIDTLNRMYPHEDIDAIIHTLRARHDEFIRYSDEHFANFIDQLQKRDKLTNSVIILSADHGESFEHGYVGHGGAFYEEQTHIPLIIKAPETHTSRIIDDLVEQVDIPATILDLANIEIPSTMEGRSLLPLLQGESLPLKAIFSMNFQSNPGKGQKIKEGGIAIWQGDYKLMYFFSERDKVRKPLLFNLKDDPDEMNDLFDQKVEIGKKLVKIIEDSLNAANERIGNSK